ncbi:putative RND superfamily exporter [Desulfocapsa sulfexigens DSM 10523]|uniref:Putative RND superfamily exporter n=1 Tax=Desulfocapsa sulfexigens (strain DSM 10523 / SB164P1) TaxID=1167006 RepID=M1P1R5_DESSD|nr:MMPL family transporter [Desulfocapsa sulfexigens]AGF77433.1 putative RND superfamily exporter [Desulfocapsa sulfexigens DSM 10523]
MLDTTLSRFAANLRRHRLWVVILMVFLAVVGGYGASKSQVDNSLEVWQSADSPDWLAYQQFLKRTNISDPLLIFIPRQVKGLTLVQIRKALKTLPDVSSCRSVGLETVQGTRGSLLTLMPVGTANPAQLAEILKQIPPIMKAHQVETYHLGGVWYLTKQLDTLSAKATTVLFPVVLLVVSIAVLLLCRTQALLILSCGLLSAVLLVGLIGLCGVKMNMVLLALPPLTLILGMAHGIHFSIKRWNPGDTPINVFCRVAPPCALSGVTTAMGFGSLLFSSYGPVRELGLWGAVGTLISLLVTFILVPVFLKPGSFSKRLVLPAGTSLFLFRKRRKILLALLLALLVAGFGIGRLQKGSLILDFFTDNSVVRLNYQAIEDAGVGLTPIEIDLFRQPLFRSELDGHLKELAIQHPEITHYVYTMTNQSEQVVSLGATMLLPDFFSSNQKVERLTILIKTISSEATLAIADEMEAFFQSNLGHSTTPYVTGSVPLYTRGQKELFSSMLQSFSVAFVAISLLIGLLLRSIKMGLIAMVPNLLPVVLVISVMGWFGIPLSVATITVASIIFGVVVDDTIHFLYGYQNQDKHLRPRQRLDQVFREVGAPIITTTLVTGTGFLAFLASPFIPLGYFGLLISLSLWMALICDLSILPVLLMEGEKNNV